ncbi:MAG: hypothetical protein ACUVT7_00660 [Thermoplasmata archaeon]
MKGVRKELSIAKINAYLFWSARFRVPDLLDWWLEASPFLLAFLKSGFRGSAQGSSAPLEDQSRACMF